MTAQWDKVEALFDAAMELPEHQRAVWLSEHCEDPDVCSEVLGLLNANAEASDFLETPAGQFASDLIRSEEAASIGRLGAYTVVRELGRGGMGAVYLAERADGQFSKQVAIKMLRPGTADESLIRRFMAERQILAGLNHPNIARLLDGGVSERGAPYFVMDFVDGRPIDVYCEEEQLDIAERLDLFLTVCDAVSYAHRQLVVHRDLKPSNILVTRNRGVKLLDFGIAKLILDDETSTRSIVTSTGQFLMTPEYASPEQVRGQPVSIASDVYQLGLLLYLMLTGTLPHRFSNRSLTDIAAVVCEQEPERPSASVQTKGFVLDAEKAEKRLRGDLDAIVMKALRKEPGQRYESVDRLAEDIRLHLAGRPVSAHAGSVQYRVRKFVRRYRWQVAAVAAFVMLLAGYAVTVTVQQQRTARERDRATEYANFLTELFASPNPLDPSSSFTSSDVTVREFMDIGVERLRTRFTGDDELRITLLETIGRAYEGLGHLEKARDLYLEMADIAGRKYGHRSGETIEALQLLSGVVTDSVAADSLFDLQLRLARDLEGGTGPLTARSLTIFGSWLAEHGRYDESVRSLRESVATLRESGPEHTDALVGALLFSAHVETSLNHIATADTLITEAYLLRKSTSGEDHPSTAVVATALAVVAELKGALAEAERLKRESLRIFRKALGDHHTYTLSAAANLTVLLDRTGRYTEAEELARDIFEKRQEFFGRDHPETVGALQNLATYILRQGRLEEAAPLFVDAHARFKEVLPANQAEIAYPLLSLTDLYLQLDEPGKAETYAREAWVHLREVLPDGHPVPAIAASRLGEALARQSKSSEAETLLVESFEQLKASQGYERYAEKARRRLVTFYESLNRTDEAARYAESAGPAG